MDNAIKNKINILESKINKLEQKFTVLITITFSIILCFVLFLLFPELAIQLLFIVPIAIFIGFILMLKHIALNKSIKENNE